MGCTGLNYLLHIVTHCKCNYSFVMCDVESTHHSFSIYRTTSLDKVMLSPQSKQLINQLHVLGKPSASVNKMTSSQYCAIEAQYAINYVDPMASLFNNPYCTLLALY